MISKERKFVGWSDHLDFLCRYMQMIRARSPLFFEQQGKALALARLMTITNIAEDRRSVTVDSLAGRPISGPEITDMTLGQMRAEIQKDAAWMANLNWTIRTSLDPYNPVICSEQALLLTGDAPPLEEAITHPSTRVYFPIYWQACLVGRIEPFRADLEEFETTEYLSVRRLVSGVAREMVISPRPLANL